MSKALRIATEDFLVLPNWFSNLHPFYIATSGNNLPCFNEFMELIRCSENKNSTGCNKQYINLMHCLRKQGLSQD